MVHHGQPKVIFILLFIILFKSNSQEQKIKYFGWSTTLNILINTGISYNFKITTDYNNQSQLFCFDVPLGIGIDTRFIEWFSLYGSVEFIYSINAYKIDIQNKQNLYYINSMFIRLPFIVKFYPLVYKSDDYANFYFSSGLLLSFWPINYYIIRRENEQFIGNSYFDKNDFMAPINSYTITNLGIRLSIGNQFNISKRGLFGLELYLLYLFLPYLNGYYFNNNYNIGGDVLVEFIMEIGITLTFGIRLKGYE